MDEGQISQEGSRKARNSRRRGTLRAFRSKIFRLRAVGERIFGALKTRLNGRLRNPRISCTPKEALFLVVCYEYFLPYSVEF
jgi:hypothetical protein